MPGWVPVGDRWDDSGPEYDDEDRCLVCGGPIVKDENCSGEYACLVCESRYVYVLGIGPGSRDQPILVEKG